MPSNSYMYKQQQRVQRALEREERRQQRAAEREAQRKERKKPRSSGGTQNSTAFAEKQRSDGKTNIYFNGPGDGAKHGHVVRRETDDGQVEYDYARDVEGNIYIDERD